MGNLGVNGFESGTWNGARGSLNKFFVLNGPDLGFFTLPRAFVVIDTLTGMRTRFM